jgi:hypothetical protein
MPNCLLTRYPIVFIPGQQSLFYNGRYWNFIPEYLEEHGYEVLNVDLPWRDSKRRKEDLLRLTDALISEKTPCHWICDQSSAQEVAELHNTYPQAFKSLQVMDHDKNFHLGNSWTTTLHNLIWTAKSPLNPYVVGLAKNDTETKMIGKSYLSIMVRLAEQDHHEGTTYAECEENILRI